jgi:hypothetical protein
VSKRPRRIAQPALGARVGAASAAIFSYIPARNFSQAFDQTSPSNFVRHGQKPARPTLYASILPFPDRTDMKSSVVLPFALAFAASASASDHVANGSFTTDLSGWTASGAGISFDAANGAPTAGSLRVNVPSASAGQSAVLTQCINFAPTGALDLLGSSRQQSAADATTLLRVVAYNATACSGTQLGTFGSTALSTETGTNGVWSRFGFSDATLPAAAQSFAVQIIVSFPNAGDSIDVSWDHIQFGEAGTLPVELMTFEVN